MIIFFSLYKMSFPKGLEQPKEPWGWVESNFVHWMEMTWILIINAEKIILKN